MNADCFASQRHRRTSRLERAVRPLAEPLEDRRVPTVYFSPGGLNGLIASEQAGPALITLQRFITFVPPPGIPAPIPFVPPGGVTGPVVIPSQPDLGETVVFATSDGTATAGADYTPVRQLVSFAPGEMTKTVEVPVVADGVAEPDETVILILSSTQPPGTPTYQFPFATALTIVDRADVTPPTVRDTRLVGEGDRPTSFALTFSEPMALGPAQDVRNYYVTAGPPRGTQSLFGGSRQVPLQSAVYDAATQTVVLTPAQPLEASVLYQVSTPSTSVLIGAPPLTDVAGNQLLASFASVGRGRVLRFRDSRLVTLRLAGGGTVELTDSPDGGETLRLLGTEPGRSILSGGVRRARRFGPFSLTSIVSPTAFVNRLKPRQFQVGSVEVG
jgi:hypothetical protein